MVDIAFLHNFLSHSAFVTQNTELYRFLPSLALPFFRILSVTALRIKASDHSTPNPILKMKVWEKPVVRCPTPLSEIIFTNLDETAAYTRLEIMIPEYRT
jgi:hypothetical protein